MEKAKKGRTERRRVGLLFDERMCKHKQTWGKHVENPERIRAIWYNLNAAGLIPRCVILNAKEAENDHLALVHSKEHIDLIKTISSKNLKKMRRIANTYDSMYFNKGSSEAAYLAAGFVIEATERVAKGDLDSAFAIVRPPGHHARESKPMGFCLFNNVAIATSVILNERPELGIKKILIVDWDVHHGNSTQEMFYKDSRVLVFSVHRHDSGMFYPKGDDGSYNMIGEGLGAGYNINVPWEGGGVGDPDYFAVWDHILLPVAKEFDPHLIIISAGFDAALGDPIGGCRLSPYGYSIMLHKLMGFARGKIVMALEGGYNLTSVANATQACIEMLLDCKPPIKSLDDLPLKSTWALIKTVRQALCIYWPILAAKIPDKVINMRLHIEVDAKRRQEDEVYDRTPAQLEHALGVSSSEGYFEDMDWEGFVLISDDETDLNSNSGAPSLDVRGMLTVEDLDPNHDPPSSGNPSSDDASPTPGAANVSRNLSPHEKGKGTVFEDLPLTTKRSNPSLENSAHGDHAKKRSKKNIVRKSSSDPFTNELPKALSELDCNDSLAFIQSLPTTDDSFSYRECSVEQLDKLCSQKLVQFLALQGLISKRLGTAHNEILRKELEKSNQCIDVCTKQISTLEQQVSELKDEVVQLRSSLAKSKEALSLSQQEKDLALVKGREEGIKLCRDRLFLTSVGQIFLKTLHLGLIDAYTKSRTYLENMGRDISHYVKIGFRTAQNQAIAQGFAGFFDIKKILENMTPSPHFKGDLSLPRDHPWWLDPMKEAVSELLTSEAFTSSLSRSSEIHYDVIPCAEDAPLPDLPSIADTNPPILE